MIRRGEKPLALIRCSFEQSQEIINKQKNSRQQHRNTSLGIWVARDPALRNKQTRDYLPTISWGISEVELADFCAYELHTYYFMN